MLDRKRAAERRAKESLPEREHRLALGRQRAAERRAAESEEERERRLAQNRERLASKRASKTEKLSLQNYTLPGDVASVAMATDADSQLMQPASLLCDGAEVNHLFPVCGAEAEAELTSFSDPLLPVPGVAAEPLDMASVVQTQKEEQSTATVEQAASTGNPSGSGGEKRAEIKQEVLEIKEFRAGKEIVSCV